MEREYRYQHPVSHCQSLVLLSLQRADGQQMGLCPCRVWQGHCAEVGNAKAVLGTRPACACVFFQ